MNFNQTPADDLSFFNEPDGFLLQPESEGEFFPEEPDRFADSQIDGLVEETELSSARSFNNSVDAGAIPTRRRTSSPHRKSRNTDEHSDQPRPRNIRSMLTIPLAVCAVVGLFVVLLISNSTAFPTTSVEIKILPPTTVTYPLITQSPAPSYKLPIRSLKIPRKPLPPPLLTSTDPTPIPTPPPVYR